MKIKSFLIVGVLTFALLSLNLHYIIPITSTYKAREQCNETSFHAVSSLEHGSEIPRNTSHICRSILTLFRVSSSATHSLSNPPSPKQVWEALQHDLVEDSVAFAHQLWEQRTNNSDIHEGIGHMMKLLTPERMRKSVVHPMPIADSSRLVEIIRRRLEDPTKHPPLSIVALGGSVVWGMESTSSYPIPNLKRFWSPEKSRRAAWANNLERVMNKVLFQGQNVVHVQNLGVGGTTSDIGALIVEYGFLETTLAPDIIIAAFGRNDFIFEADKQLEIAQNLVQAVRTMRCDGLPVFISHLDTMMRNPRTVNFMELGQTQAMVTQWYDVMGISFEKAFQDITMHDIPKIKGDEGSYNDTYNSYWGNPWWNCHPGLIYHAAVSWSITYSLANSFIDACEYETSLADGKETAHLTLNQLPPLKNKANYAELYQQWNHSQMEHDAKCRMQSSSGTSKSKSCQYKWINTKGLGVHSKDAAAAIVKSVLLNNSGWEAAGGKNQFAGGEKPGWITNTANASFEIAVRAKDCHIRTVTIVYLKSYGDKWKDSSVSVQTHVVKQDGTHYKESQSVILGGIHDSRTSVNYWQKIHLVGEGAILGDTVHVSFRLVGGSSFRINGLLLCSS